MLLKEKFLIDTDFNVLDKLCSSAELFINIAISVYCVKLFIVIVELVLIEDSELQLLKRTILSIVNI